MIVVSDRVERGRRARALAGWWRGGLISEACSGFPQVSHKHIISVLQMMVKLQLKMFLNKIYFTIK